MQAIKAVPSLLAMRERCDDVAVILRAEDRRHMRSPKNSLLCIRPHAAADDETRGFGGNMSGGHADQQNHAKKSDKAIAGKGDDLLKNPDVGRLFLGG